MTEQDSELEVKSKSQLKREMLALQELGEQLIHLSDKDLAKLELPENILEALKTAQNIKKHGARKRQIQYIGRLMREIDAQPIVDFLDLRKSNKQQLSAEFKQIEQWRDRLLAQDNQALDELFSNYPTLDKQYIRTLIRNALIQSKQAKTPKASRALFKYLSAEIQQQNGKKITNVKPKNPKL